MRDTGDGQLDVIERLERVIESRLRERPANSYVTSLFEGGEPVLAAKLREEADELAEAAGDGPATTREAADLLFHVLVVLSARQVRFADVCAELERRFGVGGHQEKASRVGRDPK
jgi:phosphoribosyl-ATP pyrophosphohydrolase